MPAQELGESELSRRLQTLRRRASLVVLVVVIVTALGVAYAYSRPAVYVAKAQIVLGPRQQNQNQYTPDPIGMPENDPRFMETQAAIVKGKAVRDLVVAKLGSAPKIAVAPLPDAAVLEVKSYRSNGKRAALIANTYAEAYVKVRHDYASDVFNEAAAELDRTAKRVQDQIDALSAQIAASNSSQLLTEQNQRVALQDQRQLLTQRMDLLLERATVQSGPPQIIDPAVAPASAARSPGKTAVQAFVLGLILGTALAFTLEYLNPRDAGPRHR
jgi:uncharacterized protein involved in exopolysaccharide biosynthesis